MSSNLSLLKIMRRYATDEAARAYFERVRWPNGAACPHCGSRDKIYSRSENARTGTRPGLYKCGTCKDTFTVTVGTVMEASKIPLHKWLIAFYMICASKTQVSALQLQRQLELGSYRTALFLRQRIRFALKGTSTGGQPVGKIVADKTCIGSKGRGYTGSKIARVSFVERDGGVYIPVVKRINSLAIHMPVKHPLADETYLNIEKPPLHNGWRGASHRTGASITLLNAITTLGPTSTSLQTPLRNSSATPSTVSKASINM